MGELFCGEWCHESTLGGWLLQNYGRFLREANERLGIVPQEKWPEDEGYAFNSAREYDDACGYEDGAEEMARLIEASGLWCPAVPRIFSPQVADGLVESMAHTSVSSAFRRLLPYTVFPAGAPCYALRPVHSPLSLRLESTLFKLAEPETHTSGQDVKEHQGRETIVSAREWSERMGEHFLFDKWKDLVDWSSFFLVGGSVLKCLLRSTFEPKERQDLDFFAIALDFYDWRAKFDEFVHKLERIGPVEVEDNDTRNYVQTLHWQAAEGRVLDMQFIWYDSRVSRERMLNSFDLDARMVGFDGRSVLAAPPFFEAMATRTCINYKLVNSRDNVSTFLPRTVKYCTRRFSLLVPEKFDVSLLGLLPLSERDFAESVRLLKRNVKEGANHSKYSGFLMNNDSFGVRNAFVRELHGLCL